MPTPIHPEYILQSSVSDAQQIQARAELDKPQPVVLRVLAVILAMLVMARAGAHFVELLTKE